jgi:hypothetical protein
MKGSSNEVIMDKLHKEEEVNEIYIDSIKAKLKLLEMTNKSEKEKVEKRK